MATYLVHVRGRRAMVVGERETPSAFPSSAVGILTGIAHHPINFHTVADVRALVYLQAGTRASEQEQSSVARAEETTGAVKGKAMPESAQPRDTLLWNSGYLARSRSYSLHYASSRTSHITSSVKYLF